MRRTTEHNEGALYSYGDGGGIAVLLAAIATAIIIAMTAGCASFGTREHYAQVQDTYITAVDVLIEHRKAGAISDDDWKDNVLPVIERGDKLLDKYDEATREGALSEARGLGQSIRALIRDQLRPLLERFRE